MRGYITIYSAYSALEEIQKGKAVYMLWVDLSGNPRLTKVNDMEVQTFADITSIGGYELYGSRDEEVAEDE